MGENRGVLGLRKGSELREGLPERLRAFFGGKIQDLGSPWRESPPVGLEGAGKDPDVGGGAKQKGAGLGGGAVVNPFVAAPQCRAMAVQEARPNHTIYINNLNEKIKKDGEGRGGGGGGTDPGVGTGKGWGSPAWGLEGAADPNMRPWDPRKGIRDPIRPPGAPHELPGYFRGGVPPQWGAPRLTPFDPIIS